MSSLCVRITRLAAAAAVFRVSLAALMRTPSRPTLSVAGAQRAQAAPIVRNSSQINPPRMEIMRGHAEAGRQSGAAHRPRGEAGVSRRRPAPEKQWLRWGAPSGEAARGGPRGQLLEDLPRHQRLAREIPAPSERQMDRRRPEQRHGLAAGDGTAMAARRSRSPSLDCTKIA